MGDRADPTQAIAGVFDDLLGGLSLCTQPHDLPMAACNRTFRVRKGMLDLFEAEMRFDRQTFLHNISIHQELVLFVVYSWLWLASLTVQSYSECQKSFLLGIPLKFRE